MTETIKLARKWHVSTDAIKDYISQADPEQQKEG
jgi:hypothetical protein